METGFNFEGDERMIGVAGCVFIAIGAMLLAKWIKDE